MSDAPLMLGVSGLRGIAGKSLTPELAVRYAGAFGTWVAQRAGVGAAVLLGRDGRAGGQVYHAAAAAGLMATGCRVVDAGITMTPTLGLLSEGYGAVAGMMVTASHNPQEWNGLKCLVSPALLDWRAGSAVVPTREWLASGLCAPPSDAAEEIIRIFREGSISWVPGPAAGQSRADVAPVEWHLNRLWRAFAARGLDFEGLRGWAQGRRVCADSVNASGAPYVQALGTMLGTRVVQLAGDGSGIFPHTPEPTEENLSGAGGGVGLTQAVPGLGADVGFAQDPDADRLAIVDERGRYIGEEYTLVLAALALLEAEGIEGGAGGRPVVVVNLSTSRMIEDVCARYGAEVVRTPVGEANVVAAMERLAREGRRVLMGGEGNGGVIWPEVSLVRDSLAAIALTLALMARTGKKVSELVEWVNSMSGSGRGYAIVKQKAALARKEDARPGLERIAGAYGGAEEGERARRHEGTRWGTVVIDRQDGVRIDFLNRFESGAAWVHVRASNTEPILRVIAEAGRREDAEALAREVGELAGA